MFFLIEWIGGKPVINQLVRVLDSKPASVWTVEVIATGETLKVCPNNLR